MPRNLEDTKKEQRTRHQRYFGKIVILLALVVTCLILWTLHKSYKESVRSASAGNKEIQELRSRNEIFPAVRKLASFSNEDFWYLWPVINRDIKTYEAPFYYEIARRFWENGDKNKAFFWTLLGRYRLNYDAYRCVDSSAGKWKTLFDQKLSNENITKGLNENTTLLEITLKDVLAWDVDSIITSSPDYLCSFTSLPSAAAARVVPKDEWVQIHTYLRQSTASFLLRKEEKLPE